MNEAVPNYLWDNRDQERAKAHGWVVETVGFVGHGETRNFGGIAIDDSLSFGSYSFYWIDPMVMGKTWTDSLVDFIAEEATKGVPLYEKAWLLYCYIDLRGKLRRATQITAWGDPC